MISSDTYETMLAVLHAKIRTGAKLTPNDAIDIDVNNDAMISLHNQLIVRRTKTESGRIEELIWSSGVQQSLLDISIRYGLSSYKVAKVYMERHFGKPFQMATVVENPFMIHDKSIREDVLKCISEDPVYSHESALLQECCGKEYEELLTTSLTRMNMCFETEAELRARGRPKTPDILFLIPMAITSDYSSSPLVVNWIDSKAIFADEVTFHEHLEQFTGYFNRYGRGLVIYWHGFVDSLLRLIEDDMVIVTDRFPTDEQWTFPVCEQLEPGNP